MSYKNVEVFRTTWGGNGLRATEPIKAGEFVIEYVGEVISLEESRRRLADDNKKRITNFYQISLGKTTGFYYSTWTLLKTNSDKNRVIDSGHEGNVSRFLNHSCNPNCETTTWSVDGDKRIGIFCLKDIEHNEELTFNYQLMQAGNRKTKCLCNSINCANFIGDKIKNIDNNR